MTMEITDLKGAGDTLLTNCLTLNTGAETETSPLTGERLAFLIREAGLALATRDGTAFLLGFEEGSAYDSLNFEWFRDRLDRFVYVDRVVVAPAARGQGLGRKLYDLVFDHALRTGRERIACEVNIEPPNPASDAFHAALGFSEIGQGAPAPGKRVRYLVKAVGAQAARRTSDHRRQAPR
jgi:predicted GNAT superfamily acetyltransferase